MEVREVRRTSASRRVIRVIDHGRRVLRCCARRRCAGRRPGGPRLKFSLILSASLTCSTGRDVELGGPDRRLGTSSRRLATVTAFCCVRALGAISLRGVVAQVVVPQVTLSMLFLMLANYRLTTRRPNARFATLFSGRTSQHENKASESS